MLVLRKFTEQLPAHNYLKPHTKLSCRIQITTLVCYLVTNKKQIIPGQTIYSIKKTEIIKTCLYIISNISKHKYI